MLAQERSASAAQVLDSEAQGDLVRVGVVAVGGGFDGNGVALGKGLQDFLQPLQVAADAGGALGGGRAVCVEVAVAAESVLSIMEKRGEQLGRDRRWMQRGRGLFDHGLAHGGRQSARGLIPVQVSVLVCVVCVICLAAACGPTPLVNTIHQADTERSSVLHRLPVRGLLVSPDGDTLATLDAEAIHLWRLPGLELAARIDAIEGLEFAPRVALSPSGHQLAVWTLNQTLWLWPDAQGKASPLQTDPAHVPQHLIGFDGSGRLLWIDAQGDVLRRADNPEVMGHVQEIPFDITGDVRRGFLLWGRSSAWLRCRPDTGDTNNEDLPTCVIQPIESFWGRWQPDLPPLGVAMRLILAARGPEIMPLDLDAQRMDSPLSAPQSSPHDSFGALALSPNSDLLVAALSSQPRLLWWSVREGRVVHTTQIPPEYLDPLWPRPILGAVFSDALTLWVLLPEQKLLRYNIQSRTFDGDWNL